MRGRRGTSGDDRARESHAGAPQDGWETLEHDGVRLDVPEGWERLRSDDCRSEVEAWGPPDSRGCGSGEGVHLPGSTTFDALRRACTSPASSRPRSAPASRHGPGTSVSVVVVSVASEGRDVVRDVVRVVLGSVDGGVRPIT